MLTVVDPEVQSLMVRSLIDIYRFEDYLPDCRMSLCKGLTQGGSNADVVIAEAVSVVSKVSERLSPCTWFGCGAIGALASPRVRFSSASELVNHLSCLICGKADADSET